MIPRKEAQIFLDHNRSGWGKTPCTNTLNLWEISEKNINEEIVMRAGLEHCCPVISDISTRHSLLYMIRNYNGKNQVHQDISVLLSHIRPDLGKEWDKNELRSKHEKTHLDVKKVMQYPEGFHRNLMHPKSRMVQYYVPDHFKTLDHIVHGEHPSFANDAESQRLYTVTLGDYCECFETARNLDHLAALVAVQTAQTLHSRGIDTPKIAKLLAQNFASTGTIREYGQQKHAQKIVDLILKEIKKSGDLPGLSKQFRELARPKVQKSYFGRRNMSL